MSAWLQNNGIPFEGSLEAQWLTADSREVRPRSIFVALAGQREDGRRYVADAVDQGAVLVIAEHEVDASVPTLVLPDLRARLAQLAATFHDRPSDAMQVAAVTGTNGKTTTVSLMEGILRAAGKRTGIIGTLAYGYGDVTLPAPNTTPDAVRLQGLLAEMRTHHVEAVAMEVSSHALQEGRVDEVSFDVGVFTNITPEHLDYHADMESYFAAKSILFERLLPASSKAARAVINTDDDFGRRLAQSLTVPTWTVGVADADFVIRRPRLHAAFSDVEVDSPYGHHHLTCAMAGMHNVYNAVESFAAVLALGVDPETAAEALASFQGVPGRLEHFEKNDVHVYVDYAHSEDALHNVLASLRRFAGARLITVFGCGGDRDRTKRPRMGHVAARNSDVVVLTSDNPRSEDPLAILDEIAPGVRDAGMQAFDGESGYHMEVDRRKAIRHAVAMARPGDFVLVAGKGHEDYQIVGRQRLPFDDRREVEAALQGMEGAS